MSAGYVYVLSNDLMPGIVKIGYSASGGKGRADGLYRNDTAVPIPFTLEFEIYVKNYKTIEKSVHADLASQRVNSGREFFRVTPEEATSKILAHVAGYSPAIDTQHAVTRHIVANPETRLASSFRRELDRINEMPRRTDTDAEPHALAAWECIKKESAFPAECVPFINSCVFLESGYDSFTLAISKDDYRKHYSAEIGRLVCGVFSATYGKIFTVKLNVTGDTRGEL